MTEQQTSFSNTFILVNPNAVGGWGGMLGFEREENWMESKAYLGFPASFFFFTHFENLRETYFRISWKLF